ncbi:hypothetical protein KMZ15_01090 [Mycoavidus sp. HKI]|uniref:hypothetical protein n=1 Tax=Mycoavidus sp. HKI TaxID=2840467 RepID=UPI001CBE5C71|nr:hypothetical protein [Mycoavidus sp. HKI]UAW64322.1 hypothetical protein KMZ15_01090 [Mycoavidus sp. HKI]
MLDFNRFKARLMEFLQSHGLTYSDLKTTHKRTGYASYIDWRADYNKSFKTDFEKLERAIELYNKALPKKDMLAAKASFVYAYVRMGSLASSPFDAISHDLTRVLNNKSFNWPSFKKGYTIPSKYFCKEKNEITQEGLVDLNIIRNILMDLVRSHGVEGEELERMDKRTRNLIWGINLKSDFNQFFNEKLLALQIAFDAYEKASIQEDWRAVRAILERIRLVNFQLYNFASAIRKALVNACSDERFWPDFPEDYKVPAHYKFRE